MCDVAQDYLKMIKSKDAILIKSRTYDDGAWTKHSEFHWSRMVGSNKLDFWPSKEKWQWKGKIKRGDVLAFIKRKSGA